MDSSNIAAYQTTPANKKPNWARPSAKSSEVQKESYDKKSAEEKKKHWTTALQWRLHKAWKYALDEDEACLTGHNGEYKPDSCSYRWQAHAHSFRDQDRIKLYNGGADKTVAYSKRTKFTHFESSAYDSEEGEIFPSGYAYEIELPDYPEDWYLDGPYRDDYSPTGGKAVPQWYNFRHWLYPYWHNSHHMIPKGTLWSTIEKTNDDKNPKCADIIRVGLLKAKYNVNNFKNVIILPQDKLVAWVLDLPRHLILKDGSKYTEKQQETHDHKAYNDWVIEDLLGIVRRMKKKARNASCTQPPDLTQDKKDLEDLSGRIFKAILSEGSKLAGEPLSGMKKRKVKK